MKLGRHVGKLCKITWRDAVGAAVWHTERDACELQLAEVETIGWVLQVTPEKVTACADRDRTNGSVNNISVIPTGWVTRVEPLA